MTLARRPSRTPVLLLACYLCTVWTLSLCNVVASLLNLLSAAFSDIAFYLSLPTCISFFENAPFFVVVMAESVLCDHVRQEKQFFQSNGACKRNLWPRCVGTCRCVIESRYVSTPFFCVCPFFTQQWRSIFRKEKRMRECVKREQEFHFAAILPEIMFPLHLSDLPVPPFCFCLHYATCLPLQCRGLGTRGGGIIFRSQSPIVGVPALVWCTVITWSLKP